MEKKNQQHYGLFTATTMIIGIVIGSGIFFKADDVLNYTGGSVLLGVLVFCIGAFSIIFGSLTLTELSIRTKKNGGVVGYYEEFISRKIAAGFGWFQTFVYYPTIIVVVSWVAGVYTSTLFGMNASLEGQVFIGLIYMIFIYVVNFLSLKLGGYFQNLTTVIKLIPLLGIAIIGFFWGDPNPKIPIGVKAISKSDVGFKWIGALAPIAFSFDGWIVAPSITDEVKNPKRTMPFALIIGPIVILSVYLLYFLGLNNMLGPEYVMSLGDNAVNKVGKLLLGIHGDKIILIFIIVAVLGVVNGVTLGSLRMPQALANKNMIPGGKKIATIHPKFHLSIGSCLVSFIVSFIWMGIHYITQKTGVLGQSDISEISIVFSYICYIILYVKVFIMKKKGIVRSKFKGIVCPILGILGSMIILIGGITSNPTYVPIFIGFCLAICIAGYLFYKNKNI